VWYKAARQYFITFANSPLTERSEYCPFFDADGVEGVAFLIATIKHQDPEHTHTQRYFLIAHKVTPNTEKPPVEST